MANSRFLQNVKNRIPFFKNVSTNFIFLATLFILSIIMYYMFKKHSLENMENKIIEGARGSRSGSSGRGGGSGRGPSILSRIANIMNRDRARQDAIRRTS